MSHKAIEAKRLSAGTPVESTLDALQTRLNQAETGAKKLSKHLNKYGYKSEEKESKETKQKQKIEAGASKAEKTAKKKAKENAVLQKSFEEMATRVCKMESTLHTLKIGVNGLEAERSMSKDKYDVEIVEMKEKHKKEMKKLEDELELANKEVEDYKRRDKEIQDELGSMIKNMRETGEAMLEKDAQIEDLEAAFQKASAQRSDLEIQLQRETTLRQSVEDAHEALLMRIRDMEVIVDSERGQVNDLVDNWDNAKRQAEATKEAFENEHDLRTHLEGLVTQHEEEFDLMKEKLTKLAEDKNFLDAESTKLKRENKSLKQQKELSTKAHEELKTSYDSLLKDCQKLHEALKIAATDNKALIAQHKDGMQKEKDRVAAQLAMQDKMLDNAKEAIIKELEREKAAVRSTEMENVELKASMKSLEMKVSEKDHKIALLERKYESDLTQLNSLVETARKDREKILNENNQKILELQQNVNELNNENMDSVTTIREMKIELGRLQKIIKSNDNEKQILLGQLSSAEQNQMSQKQIESAFSEILKAKNKLAYENGMLQSKVDQLNNDINGLSLIKMEYENLKQSQQATNNQYNIISIDVVKLKEDVRQKDDMIKGLQVSVSKKDQDLKSLVKSREEALQEAQKLLLHTESLEEKYTNKINAMESSLKLSQADNKKLAQSFEGIMLSHSKLQATSEELQIKLGRKDSEMQALLDERKSTQNIVKELQGEMDNLQKKILSLQESDSDELSSAREAAATAESKAKKLSQLNSNLERESKVLNDEVESLRKDMKIKMQQMEDDAEERDMKEKSFHAKSQEEREEIETDYERQIEKLKKNLKQTEKKLTSCEEENVEKKKKLKKVKEECYSQKKEVECLKLETKKHTTTISNLVARIEGLEGELRYSTQLQNQANISSRQFEDEIEREKFIRMETESRCMSLESKEKELEKKLLKATKENVKASNELQQAQCWFRKKVEELERELDSARQTQYILEQTNLEQEKLLESKSEEAKKIVRASRLAVNKISSEVSENLWETKGLKRVVQAERDYANRAAQKYEKLMESSARKVEELARELDKAHEKARKTR